MPHSFRTFAMLLIVALGTGGCCGDRSGQRGGAPSSADIQAALADLEDENSQPSQEEVSNFANQLETAVRDRDREFLEGAVDWSHVLQRATAGFELSEATMRGMRKGFLESAAQSGGLFGQVLDQIGEEGSYELLSVQQVDGKWVALFRMSAGDARLNYHRLQFRKGHRGDLRVADAFIFATGEDLTQTMRRMMLPFLAQQNASIVDRLAAKDRASLSNMEQIQQLTQAVRSGQPEQALHIYRNLPPSLQSEKTILIVRIEAATQLADAKEVKDAVEAMQSHHPGDACLDLMAIDYYIQDEKYDQALESVNRLNAAVGGDPVLTVMQGNIALLQRDFVQANELAESAINADPELEDAYWLTVSVALAEIDHDATLVELKRIDQQFELDWGDFSQIPEYAEFAKSPQHREWLRYLNQRRRR